MNLIEKIIVDSGDYFCMPDPSDYFSIFCRTDGHEVGLKKVYYEIFPKPFQTVLRDYEMEFEPTKHRSQEDWVLFYFDAQIEGVETLIKKITDQWQNLRTKSKRGWLNKRRKHTAKQARDLSKYQGYRCAYCSAIYTEYTSVHKDHVKPVINGGTTIGDRP